MSFRASIEFLGALETVRGIRIAPGWEDSLEGRRIFALLWAARQIEAREWIALAREHLPRPIDCLDVAMRWRALPYEVRHQRPEKGPQA